MENCDSAPMSDTAGAKCQRKAESYECLKSYLIHNKVEMLLHNFTQFRQPCNIDSPVTT